MKQLVFRDENLSNFFKEKGILRKKCICCNSSNNSIWTEIFNGKVKFLVCKKCGFIWSSPICSSKNLNRYYDNYITKRRLSHEKKMKLRDLQYDQDVTFITKTIKSGKFLDIGCNGGFFLSKFPKKIKKYGIDIDKKAIYFGKKKFNFGKNLIHGSFLKKRYKNQFFDGVILRGTIEHLIDPEIFLKRISKILKKNGSLFILATPNSDCISAKLFKEDWTLFHPIQHISHFDSNNISIMAKRSGLILNRVEYPYLGTPYENFVKDSINLVFCLLKKIVKSRKKDFLNSPPFFKNMMSLEFKKI